MKAFFLTEIGKTEVREIEKPSPKSGEVLLEVGKVGFCGGDLNGFKGLFPLQEYPNVLGHEVGATIVELGDEVPESIQIGSRVTLYPYLACGTCVACRKGRPNACKTNKTMGVRRPGAMTRYITAPWQDVFPSDKLSLSELALVEPLTVGFHAASRGRVSSEDRVAVMGCGIVGLGAVASAVNKGAQVTAVDLDDSKLEIARKAITLGTGARGLRSILEGVLLDTMYDLPSLEGVSKVVIDETVIKGDSAPLMIYENPETQAAASE